MLINNLHRQFYRTPAQVFCNQAFKGVSEQNHGKKLSPRQLTALFNTPKYYTVLITEISYFAGALAP